MPEGLFFRAVNKSGRDARHLWRDDADSASRRQVRDAGHGHIPTRLGHTSTHLPAMVTSAHG